jgi:ferric-dicitrate binding protein FerR (iron transport regulator)
VRARGVSAVTSLTMDTASGSVLIDGDLSALTRLAIDTGSGSVELKSSAQPSLEIRIDTGSGSVNVDAPGATVRERDDETYVRLKDGAGSGVIDTGSGSVTLDFK